MRDSDFQSFVDVFKDMASLNKRISDLENDQKYMLNTLKHIERFLYYQEPFQRTENSQPHPKYQPELFSDEDLKQDRKDEKLAENLTEWLTGFVDAINGAIKTESNSLNWEDIIKKLVKAVDK